MQPGMMSGAMYAPRLGRVAVMCDSYIPLPYCYAAVKLSRIRVLRALCVEGRIHGCGGVPSKWPQILSANATRSLRNDFIFCIAHAHTTCFPNAALTADTSNRWKCYLTLLGKPVHKRSLIPSRILVHLPQTRQVHL